MQLAPIVRASAAPCGGRAGARREALAEGDFRWAAELADYVLAIDNTNTNAKKVKAQALVELGERQVNAIARNYYLSSAASAWIGKTSGCPSGPGVLG
jgi:alkyl sulfatase BDS1-like metallo-beta-lactamase superfamily hydrolase